MLKLLRSYHIVVIWGMLTEIRLGVDTVLVKLSVCIDLCGSKYAMVSKLLELDSTK